jgi:3-hydroxy acid dehydrogenase / malonic semialdehyde reductase
MTRKTVLITGATSGIGEACARKFAANNYNPVITGRREERLQQLKTELEKQYAITCNIFCFDIRDKKATEDCVATLKEKAISIDVLVNNAGLALGRSYFEECDRNDWDVMMDTNVNGLLNMSQAIIPMMIAQGSGHIINMGSVAGKEVYEKGNMYCATKFAVDAITRAQRIDLLRHRIRVTGIHPGAVETEFSLVRFKGNEETAGSIYKGYQPLSGEDVAETIYFCASLPAHVCVNDLSVTCTSQANSYYTLKDPAI